TEAEVIGHRHSADGLRPEAYGEAQPPLRGVVLRTTAGKASGAPALRAVVRDLARQTQAGPGSGSAHGSPRRPRRERSRLDRPAPAAVRRCKRPFLRRDRARPGAPRRSGNQTWRLRRGLRSSTPWEPPPASTLAAGHARTSDDEKEARIRGSSEERQLDRLAAGIDLSVLEPTRFVRTGRIGLGTR